jgi:hypothetical protein
MRADRTGAEALAFFAQAGAPIEKGTYPPGGPDRAASTRALVREICGAPWQTAEERREAQRLARLERLRWAEEQKEPALS